MKIIQFIFMLTLLAGCASTPGSPGKSEASTLSITKDAKIEITEYVSLAVPFLNDLSENWSYLEIEKHMHPVGYGGSGDLYKEMAQKSVGLGDFQKCPGQSLGEPEGLDLPSAKALVGTCDFENGTASVMIVFLVIENELNIVGFVIKNQNITRQSI